MDKRVNALAVRLRENVNRVVVGKQDTIDLMLCALIAGGHVLLEDVPGTGKTLLAKALAASLGMSFARIQFTPDLLPSDVTGLSVYNQQKGEFVFSPGAVFANIVLADEINRATPRTQASLLECMEERQVTVDGVTRPLEAPFIVLATQNPIETQGVFPLPEAQLDRFLMRLKPDYPTTEEAVGILMRFAAGDALAEIKPCAGREEVIQAQKMRPQVHVSEAVMRYIAALCERTRILEKVQLGVSPRGMLRLMHACQALALIRGRDFVTPDDVKYLSVPVLAHRVVVRGLYGHTGQGEAVIQEALAQTGAPTEADV